MRVDDQVEEQVEEEEGDARAVVQRVLGRGKGEEGVRLGRGMYALGFKGEEDRVLSRLKYA